MIAYGGDKGAREKTTVGSHGGNWISDSRYRVSGFKQGDALILQLSTADQRDQNFVGLLRDRVQSARKERATEAHNEHRRLNERWNQIVDID